MTKIKAGICAVIATCLLVANNSKADPMGTAFTYQGKLTDGGAPVTGLYDLTFKLFDGPNSATQVGADVPMSAVPVTNGLFTLRFDFVDNAHPVSAVYDGTARWLEIWASTNGATPALLLPRQEVTPTPHAIYAATAGVASVANGVSASTIVQGQSLQIGVGNGLAGTYATIAGGGSNTLSGDYAAILGGFGNTAVSNSAAIGGGSRNVAMGDHALVAGGEMNTALGDHAFVGGGAYNSARGYDVVCGGLSNSVTADMGGINSGVGNHVSGYASWIGGGYVNYVSANFGVVCGGVLNRVLSDYATIAGGSINTVEANATYAVIAGGSQNIVSASAARGAILGGQQNHLGHPDSLVAGRGAVSRSQDSLTRGASFSQPGDGQCAEYILTANTGGFGLWQSLAGPPVPVGSAMAFDAVMVAKAFGDFSAAYEIKGLIRNYGGVVAFVGNPIKTPMGTTGFDNGSIDIDWDASGSASNQRLQFQIHDPFGVNVRYVVRVQTAEVSY